MGWLPWSSGDSTKASDGGRIAPDRSSRARCWEGRDRFFACLDQHDILDAIKDDKEARQKCAKEIAEFETACSQTWVRPRALEVFPLLVLGMCPHSFTALLRTHAGYCKGTLLTRLFRAGEILQGEARDGIQPGPDDRANQAGGCGAGAATEVAGLEALTRLNTWPWSDGSRPLYIMYHIHSCYGT